MTSGIVLKISLEDQSLILAGGPARMPVRRKSQDFLPRGSEPVAVTVDSGRAGYTALALIGSNVAAGGVHLTARYSQTQAMLADLPKSTLLDVYA